MLPDILKRYVEPGKVKIVWHDFAWIGEESKVAAQAARCAGRQNQFWPFHDYLYAHQRGENGGQFSAANLKRFAGEVRLDAAGFSSCLDGGGDLPQIRQDLSVGRARGVNATPAFFINGKRFNSASAAQFFMAIDAELAQVGAP